MNLLLVAMGALADLLSSRVKAEVFRLLFSIHGRELYVRKIERQTYCFDLSDQRVDLKFHPRERVEVMHVEDPA